MTEPARQRPLLIAHRGASGYQLEHTLAAYQLAIEQGADFIELDVVSSKDNVLVIRHENEIGGTTDVATRPEFAGRRLQKIVDGVPITGWFTEDFTLAELKSLWAAERIPAVRPATSRFNGRHQIATLDEVVDLARTSLTRSGTRVGLYVETKHPTYFRSIGLPLEEVVLEALARGGYDDSDAPVFLQSFETANLKHWAQTTRYRLIQLIEATGAPFDLSSTGDRRSYADLVSPAGLAEISSYAFGIGPHKDVLIPRDSDGVLLLATPVVADAHRYGLAVHPWTFRRENFFLPSQFRRGTDPAAPGDLAGEIDRFVSAGIDGLFIDNPDLGRRPGISALR
jgi:glycerophosphoryl diester phosphodiesterase